MHVFYDSKLLLSLGDGDVCDPQGGAFIPQMESRQHPHDIDFLIADRGRVVCLSLRNDSLVTKFSTPKGACLTPVDVASMGHHFVVLDLKAHAISIFQETQKVGRH